MKESSLNWLKIAEKDLKAAKILLKAKEPMGTVFHLHAAVEKILKGLSAESGITPPKIHNLQLLAVDSCRLSLEKQQELILIELNQVFIDSRYPSDIEEFEDKYNYAYCKKLLKEVEGVYSWLKSLLIAN